LSPQEETRLLQRYRRDPESRQGREAASRLLALYQRRVYAWCFRYLREHERALDLAQEVLIKAFRGLRDLKDGERFGSWLYSIACNRCIDEVRRPGLLVDPELDPDELRSSAPRPDCEFEHWEDEKALLDLIDETLESPEGEALYLRCVERMPVDAITQALDLGEASGARAVLQRARRKLRAALERREKEGGGDE